MFGLHQLTILLVFSFAFSGCLGTTNKTLDDIDANTSRMADEMKAVREIEKIGKSIEATQTEIASMNQSFSGFWRYVQEEMAKVSTSSSTTPSTSTPRVRAGAAVAEAPKNTEDYAVSIAGKDCIQAPSHHVAEVVTNYEGYPENKRAATLKLLAKFPMLRLTRVENIHSLPQNTRKPTDLKISVIRATLHPTENWLKEEDFFPRFVLQCVTSGSEKVDFLQICSLAKNRDELMPFVRDTFPSEGDEETFDRFGIDGFYSEVKVLEGVDECKTSEFGPNAFSYNIQIQPNNEDIAKLKAKSINDLKESMPLLGAIADGVSNLFGDSFFEIYYKNYYSVWIEEFRP